MPGISPTRLTLRHLRAQGWLAQVVERWMPQGEPGAREKREAYLDCVLMVRGVVLAAILDRERASVSGMPMEEARWNLVAQRAESLAREMEAKMPPEPFGSPGKRLDLFGCIDIICLDGEPGVLGAQACAYSGVSAHLREIREGTIRTPTTKGEMAHQAPKRDLALRWLTAGNRLSIFGWRKVDNRWVPRIVPVTTEQLIERKTA